MPTGKKLLVVVTRRLPDGVEMRMRELFDARLNPDDKPLTQAQLVEAVKTADVLVPTVTDHIDRAVLSQSGERLKLIANFGNGVDNIDVATALQRGITVTNTPGVLTEDTADMTMALLLAVPRRLAEGAQVLTSDREWTGWSPTWMLRARSSPSTPRGSGRPSRLLRSSCGAACSSTSTSRARTVASTAARSTAPAVPSAVASLSSTRRL